MFRVIHVKVFHGLGADCRQWEQREPVSGAPMKYRGTEYAIARTTLASWRWSVNHDCIETAGQTTGRIRAIARARRHIDHLIKKREQLNERRVVAALTFQRAPEQRRRPVALEGLRLPRYWRARADEFRTKAQSALRRETRESLLQIATQYETFAESLEKLRAVCDTAQDRIATPIDSP